MPLFDEFPYTNFHELNLDWIIKSVKQQKDSIDELISVLRYALKPVFDTAKAAEDCNNHLDAFLDNVIMFVNTADGWTDQPSSYTKGVFLNMIYGKDEALGESYYLQLFIAGAWSELPRACNFRTVTHTADTTSFSSWYAL